MIKQLTNKEIITSKRSKKKEDRDTVHYKLNDIFMNYSILFLVFFYKVSSSMIAKGYIIFFIFHEGENSG